MDFDLNKSLINYSKYDLGNLLKVFESYCTHLQGGGNNAIDVAMLL